MAVRSINLKMILPRGESGAQVRRSLWVTHRVVNEAVAEIEAALLLCRGLAYWTEGEEGDEVLVSEEEVGVKALAWARQVQVGNGKPEAGSDADVLSELRRLYEALVPSVNLDENGEPLEGDAQAAGGFASPLMDSRSEGFQSIFDKILDPLPAWVAKMQGETAGWQEESAEWLQTEQSQKLQHASGSPAAWVRRLRTGQAWQEAFVADQQKKRREAGGVPTLIRRLKSELGLLPLMRPPITSRFVDQPEGLTPWDRLAIRLAVAHLLSWESWNHRAAAEHRTEQARLDRMLEGLAPFGAQVEALRAYERERHEELKRVALADDERPFRIGRRAIRAWDRVRDAWRGKQGATESSRLQALADLQTKLRGRFGDPVLFRWLAREGREHLWQSEDPLPAVAVLNAQQRTLDRRKNHALYTPAEPCLHPRWTNYEAPGGANLRNYGLEVGEAGLTLKLPLLKETDGGLLETKPEIPLAPSGQLDAPAWKGKKGKERRLVYESAHQQFSATLGGSEILLSRRHLENRQPEELAEGDVGPVWFKLVVDVESQAPEDWLDGRGRVRMPPEVHHFNSGLATHSRHADALAPGLRVLSVDLGVRTFAACSVFELVRGKPAKGLAFLADAERDLWARHERSVLLALPGEAPSPEALLGRRAAYDALGPLRRDLGRLKDVLRLSVVEDTEERAAGLADLRETLAEEAAQPNSVLDAGAVDQLSQATGSDQPAWQELVGRVYRDAERRLGLQIGQWRASSRRRAADAAERAVHRAYSGGKSAWAVEYLDNVRRFLIGWSLHGRRFGQINRADRARRGTFAVRLLEHVNALKQDRVKAGSDMIVQAARGYLPDRRGWRQAYEPCRLILFEDLARYRFRTDRPRRENSQLMRWNHRQVTQEAEMQAGLYGIGVGTTGAGFSSRFHARTGAPGCRSRLLSAEDLQSPFIQEQLEFLSERLGIPMARFQPGTRVPWEGGQELATIGPDGGLVVVHADLNAAQNLQRRFWTRHGDAYRLSGLEVGQGGATCWYPDRDGTRLRGALGLIVGGEGYARLVAAPDGDGWVLESVTRAQWRAATGARARAGDEAGEDEEDEPVLEGLERGAARQVFFRDPSGLVLPAPRWFERGEFWNRVRHRVAAGLGLVDDPFV